MSGDESVEDPIALAERAARAGGMVAGDAFRTVLEVREKRGKMDPVTEADLDAQARIVEVLTEAGVDDPIVGEEEDALKSLPGAGRAWVIDPIDGTNNFARGTWPWAVCVAVAEDGEPAGGVTHMPAVGDTYVAREGEAARNGVEIETSERGDPEALIVAPIFGLKDRDRPAYRRVTAAILDRFGDVRQTGSGQSTLAMLAAGGLDAAVSTVEMSPWDTLVGVSLVRAAGGRVTDLDGNRWRPASDSLIASNGVVHERVLDAVREVEG